jgi:site-specific recombinase XerD
MNSTNVAISTKTGTKRTSSLTITLRERPKSKGVSLYFNVTYGNQNERIYTGFDVQKGELKNGKLKGKPEIDLVISEYKLNMERAYSELLRTGQSIDLKRIVQSMKGKPIIEEKPLLFVAIDRYVQSKWFDNGSGFKETSKGKAERFFKNIKRWAKQYFNREGIDLTEIKSIHDNEIIKFMISQRKSGNNHAQDHVTRFKSFFNYAIGNDWIVKNPFMNFKPKIEKVKIKYLTIEDIAKLENLELTKESVYDVARDLFLFCCHTGLSYADLKNVSLDHIKTYEDGFKYLVIPRMKNDEVATIPLRKKAIELIEKYRNESTQKIFKVPTNQQVNRLLKELGSMAELSILPTWHIGRKTCATLLISDGMPVALVSKILGHSNMSTTLNHYGKINEKPIIEAFRNIYQND